jgi:hypothetical protein
LLTTVNVGTTIEANTSPTLWAIKIGQRTVTPEKQIALFDTGGSNPNTKFRLDFVHIQALVRAGKHNYQEGFAKALEVKDALLGLDAQTVVVGAEQIRVDGITMLSDIAFLRNDENDCPLFSLNLRMIQEREANALTHRDSL